MCRAPGLPHLVSTGDQPLHLKNHLQFDSNLFLVQTYISQLLPAYQKQHAAAVGRTALVVHYAYFTQEKDLLLNAPGLLQEYSRCCMLHTPRLVKLT